MEIESYTLPRSVRVAARARPAYLGTLNDITLAESRAARAFWAWAQMTGSLKVQQVVALVAERKEEHSLAFARRIACLGYVVLAPAAVDLHPMDEEAYLGSNRSDVEKLRQLFPTDGPDLVGFVNGLLSAYEYDPHTRALMERYVAEEEECAQRLRTLLQELDGASIAEPTAASSRPSTNVLGRLCRGSRQILRWLRTVAMGN